MRFRTLRFDFQQPEWFGILAAVVLAQFVLAELVVAPFSYGASIVLTTILFTVYRGAVGRPCE